MTGAVIASAVVAVSAEMLDVTFLLAIISGWTVFCAGGLLLVIGSLLLGTGAIRNRTSPVTRAQLGLGGAALPPVVCFPGPPSSVLNVGVGGHGLGSPRRGRECCCDAPQALATPKHGSRLTINPSDR